MFINSLIEELCTNGENNKAGCTLTFGGQCMYIYIQREREIFLNAVRATILPIPLVFKT